MREFSIAAVLYLSLKEQGRINHVAKVSTETGLPSKHEF